MFSTMITVPSTIMPRSMAPTDSRFADSPRITVIITARRSATGIVAATISARAAQVTEKHPLDQEDQGNTEQQIVQYRLHGDRDQVTTIVERDDLDAGRQRSVGVDLLDGRAHTPDHVHGTFKFLHQDD